MIANQCPSWMGKIAGHNFVARYTVIGQELETAYLAFGTYEGPAYQRLYEGDVCTRCGMVVNNIRETPTDTTTP